jgi:hypothetical protein
VAAVNQFNLPDNIVASCNMAITWVSFVAVAVILGAVYSLLQVGKRDPRMPKGPPTVPILGNAHQIPSSGLYKQ